MLGYSAAIRGDQGSEFLLLPYFLHRRLLSVIHRIDRQLLLSIVLKRVRVDLAQVDLEFLHLEEELKDSKPFLFLLKISACEY